MQNLFIAVGLSGLLLGFIFELSIYISTYGWQHKRYFASLSIFVSAAGIGLILGSAFTLPIVLLAFFYIYRTVNTLRLVENRMHNDYLRNTTKNSYTWIVLLQLVSIIAWIISINSSAISIPIFTITCALLAFAGLAILVITIINIYRTKPLGQITSKDLQVPTLTVAIAARNENHNLKECLEAVLASNYPKLEIIVLDDCSQDHTAQVIKAFAHDGVRFVQGDPPQDSWLAKNNAYQTLLNQATGELILFIGVDVRLHPSSLRQLVDTFIARKVSMMSILPKRTHGGAVAALIQPMRYWWELALPRLLLKHPPVLSTSWLVKRSAINKLGGFKSVTHAIVPEEHLAKEFAKTGAYAFVRSNKYIDLTTHKDFRSQWLTAVRTRYPQVHRRPEIVAVRTLVMAVVLLAPFVLLPFIFFSATGLTAQVFLLLTSVICLALSHIIISVVTNPVAAYAALINFPLIVLADIIALHISMYRYEFSEVVWKGRDVSGPIMHVIPRLPDLKD